MRVVAVVAASLVLGLGGCATLDRGTADTLYVLSDPPGAQATTSAGSTCVTPCTLDVNRRDEFTVTITKAGFETRTVEVKTRLSGSGVGSFMENVVTGGAGMVVDAATGAALEHVPDPVDVTLKPIAAPPQAMHGRPQVSGS